MYLVKGPPVDELEEQLGGRWTGSGTTSHTVVEEEDLYNIWMLQLGQKFGLGVKAADWLDLDGDGLVGDVVEGLVDCGATSGP